MSHDLTIASDGRVDVGDRARFKTNGDVGIGTQDPQTALHIVNTEDAPDEGATGKIQGLLIENNGTRSKDYALEIRTALSNELDGRVFTVSNSGTVHIGSNLNWNTPNFENTSFNLYVEDGIRAEAIRIDLAEQAGWADYVFDDNYNPLSIEALRRYIKTNKKLPEVPSTEMLEKNGIDVSSMMALQMKKIEELTIYILELEKRIKKLERDAK